MDDPGYLCLDSPEVDLTALELFQRLTRGWQREIEDINQALEGSFQALVQGAFGIGTVDNVHGMIGGTGPALLTLLSRHPLPR